MARNRAPHSPSVVLGLDSANSNHEHHRHNQRWSKSVPVLAAIHGSATGEHTRYDVVSYRDCNRIGPNSAAARRHRQASPSSRRRRKAESKSSGVSDLLDAVTSALNSSDPSADPDQVIQDTITKLLSGDGTGTNTTGSTATTTTTTGAGAAPTTAQSFAATLKAHGVDLSQFRNDLAAAVKNAQNGQINPAAALKSIAPGSSLNLTA